MTSLPDQVASLPAVALSARDNDGPRRLLSEVESLRMDTSADDGGRELTEAISDLEQDIEVQRKRIEELEGLVERYKSRASTLEHELELARHGQLDLDEEKEVGPEVKDGGGDHDGGDDQLHRAEHHQEHRRGQREEGCVVDHDGEKDEDHDGVDADGGVGDEPSDLDDGVADKLSLVIEQLEEENRYLKVVYTERISHLVGENRALRNQLLEAEQELLELDSHTNQERKPALAVSVDFGGHHNLVDHCDSLTHPLNSPNSRWRNTSSPVDNHRLEAFESAAIGYSPLGAGRLLYR